MNVRKKYEVYFIFTFNSKCLKTHVAVVFWHVRCIIIFKYIYYAFKEDKIYRKYLVSEYQIVKYTTVASSASGLINIDITPKIILFLSGQLYVAYFLNLFWGNNSKSKTCSNLLARFLSFLTLWSRGYKTKTIQAGQG